MRTLLGARLGGRPRSPGPPATTAMLVLAAGLLTLTACGSQPRHPHATVSSPTTATTGWSGAIFGASLPKPEFTLTDTAGKPYDFKQRTRGQLTLLYFGYTHCPDVCPLTMAELAQVVHALPAAVARKITVVFVTTDPARDTPRRLRQWLANFSASFVGLTGNPRTIQAAQRAVGMPPATKEPLGSGNGNTGYGVDHGAFVYAFTADDLAHLAYPQGVQPDALAADVRRLATGDWSAG
jgi:protein SCO1